MESCRRKESSCWDERDQVVGTKGIKLLMEGLGRKGSSCGDKRDQVVGTKGIKSMVSY